MIRKLIIVLLFVPFASVYGQETDFDSMKAQMTDQSLPLVNITITDPTDVLKADDYIEGSIEIVDKQKRTDPDNESVSYLADFRIRGGSITGLDKKSLAVKLFEYSKKGKKKDKDVAVFGIRVENSWILDAMGYDKMRMRNRVCFDLWNEMSSIPYDTSKDGNPNENNPEKRNGTKGVFVEVFINGSYNGLYCMSDKIDRKLLNLTKYDDNDTEDDLEDDAVYGLLYQGHECEGDAGHLLSYDSNAWELEYPDDYSTNPNTWEPLKALIGFVLGIPATKTSKQAIKVISIPPIL